ncbi:inosose dehydratase [Pseudarthrobacter sp. PvP004]|uniref:sugar phosphate isomerase/epimerase family protein n=1 Tax=Pseudarthrobacter sp. PvP004 TaxID=2817850 RepID=UPI001AE5E5E8|nr:sugar phosphate isomerase/epimerase [Pseudarthrobacter sp. PvP004]MBP2266179.1 inosose dehydratase [Pseudarthrobacter sp. PvP004]
MDPLYRLSRQEEIYREIRSSGFSTVMLELVGLQTLQHYQQVLQNADLRVAPGIVPVPFPMDFGLTISPGSVEFAKWFDPVRRLAEVSNYFDLKTAFLCPHMPLDGVRNSRVSAVGYGYSRERMDHVVEIMSAAAEVLAYEGIRGGLHNHVGTWIETQSEVEYVLDNTDPLLLGAAFDVGHLEWAGADATRLFRKYRDRITDLHIKDIDKRIAQRTREQPGPYFDVYEEEFFLEPGRGDIDFPTLLSELPDDYGGWIIVEVDRTSMSPKTSAEVSWEWVQKLTAHTETAVNGC